MNIIINREQAEVLQLKKNWKNLHPRVQVAVAA